MKQVIIRPSLLAVRKLIPTSANDKEFCACSQISQSFIDFGMQIRNINKIKVGKKTHKTQYPQKHLEGWWSDGGSGCTQAFIQTHRHGTNEGLHPAPSGKMLPLPPRSRKMNVCPEKGSCRVSAKFIFQSSIFTKIYTANVDLAILILFLCCFRIYFKRVSILDSWIMEQHWTLRVLLPWRSRMSVSGGD